MYPLRARTVRSAPRADFQGVPAGLAHLVQTPSSTDGEALLTICWVWRARLPAVNGHENFSAGPAREVAERALLQRVQAGRRSRSCVPARSSGETTTKT